MWYRNWSESFPGQRATLAGLIAMPLFMQPLPSAADAIDEPDLGGVRIQIDNDLFAGREDDRDYTGGFAVTISGREARDNALSLNPWLSRIDAAIGMDHSEAITVRHAQQLGFMAFTPADITIAQAQQDDRPYASLVFLANGRMQVEPDNRVAWSSTLSVGVLGLSASEDVQNAVHSMVGSPRARGYDHQISAGGEPTARYTLARHSLWIANPTSTLDVKTTVQGSVGYLTEGSAAISARIGRFSSPWWSFTPEQTDYLGAPTPVEVSRGDSEFYVFTGVRLKARAYNAVLQGQFRDSEVRYSAAELEPVLAEAWIGVVTHLGGQTQASYMLNYQTREIRHGPAARDALWGSVQLTHSF
jgi:hypothetical protein